MGYVMNFFETFPSRTSGQKRHFIHADVPGKPSTDQHTHRYFLGGDPSRRPDTIRSSRSPVTAHWCVNNFNASDPFACKELANGIHSVRFGNMPTNWHSVCGSKLIFCLFYQILRAREPITELPILCEISVSRPLSVDKNPAATPSNLTPSTM